MTQLLVAIICDGGKFKTCSINVMVPKKEQYLVVLL